MSYSAGSGRLLAALRRPAMRAIGLAVAFALILPASSLATQAPYSVRSASLSQEGRSLRWTVTLDHRISSAGLARERRSLCLLVRTRHRRRELSLCVAPGAPAGAEARLRLRELIGARAGDPPRRIRARVRRPGSDTLTASFRPSALGLGYESVHWQVLSTAPSPCAAGGSTLATAACSVDYPARARLARLHTPRLVGCVASGSSLVYGGPTDTREIALTFDDGPWGDPPTIDFVNLLARYHVPATFFEIGDQISEYDPTGAIERKMLADGDMIGDHTWTHPDMLNLSPVQQRSQLELTASAIRRATGFTPCLWRPPYGATSGQLQSLARSLGFLTVYWNIDPRDWSLPGVAAIEGNVLSNARSGGIVELHFGGGPRRQTLAALPHIIDTLRARGYRFVNLAQMLGLRLIYK